VLLIYCGSAGSFYSQGKNTDEPVIHAAARVAGKGDTVSLGTKVTLLIEFENRGEKAVYLKGAPHIRISANGKEYLTYVGAGSGYSIDGIGPLIKIEPKQKVTRESAILWNQRPRVSHLSANWKAKESKGRILSDFAFQRKGRYLVKVRQEYVVEDGKSGLNTKTTMTEPIEVMVARPVGSDLQVWNLIKYNSEIACFLHTSNFITREHKTKERVKLKREVEYIIDSFPTSDFAFVLKKNLLTLEKTAVKNKAALELLSVGSLAVLTAGFIGDSEEAGVVIKFRPSKNVYKLGEPISFSFELKNNSKNEISILDSFGVGTGLVGLKVSKDGEMYHGANDPNWGTVDILAKTKLAPGKTLESSSSVLWDLEKQGVSKFMFKNRGEYSFKATYTLWVEGEKVPVHIESKPVRITLTEPQGINLSAWEKIKDNGDFAYFLQKNEILIPVYQTEKREKFLREIDDIIISYPDSFYSQELRKSLSKFRENELKRRELKNTKRIH